MKNFKRVFLFNPNAGNLKTSKIIPEINYYMQTKQDNNIDIFEIEKYRELKQVISYFSHKYKEQLIFYSIGGDGTLNMVVNGLMETGCWKTKIGIIPLGTGNDFYKTLSKSNIQDKFISSDISFSEVDLGLIEYNLNEKMYFINNVSVGLPAEVAYYINNNRNNIIPKEFKYLVATLMKLINYVPVNINTINNEEVRHCLSRVLVSVSNGKSFGNGIKLSPHALINDGLFDIGIVNDLSSLKTFSLLMKILFNLHINDKNYEHYQVNRIALNNVVPFKVNADGEIFYTDRLYIHNLSKQLNIITKDNHELVKKLKKI